MRKIFYLSSLFLFLFSCEKEWDGEAPYPLSYQLRKLQIEEPQVFILDGSSLKPISFQVKEKAELLRRSGLLAGLSITKWQFLDRTEVKMFQENRQDTLSYSSEMGKTLKIWMDYNQDESFLLRGEVGGCHLQRPFYGFKKVGKSVTGYLYFRFQEDLLNSLEDQLLQEITLPYWKTPVFSSGDTLQLIHGYILYENEDCIIR